MPANLSPEYKDAEAAFRQARDAKERLECLRQMLRAIPKHKGTEHLQADIKTRIKHLTDEVATAKKSGRTGPVHVIRAEGAAQVALIGPPNAGKSSLHHRLTGSQAEVGPYPFTTQEPRPGMLAFHDIHFQLIDLPPICMEHPLPWIAKALQPSDGCLLVVDLQQADCLDQAEAIRTSLAAKRVILGPEWPSDVSATSLGDEAGEIRDPFTRDLPTLLVATHADELSRPLEELSVFRELLGISYPAMSVSSTTGEGLEAIGPWLFEHLAIVRVYTKAPGRPPDSARPFTVRRGDRVQDVAALVHRDLGDAIKFARIWGEGHFDGQQVGREEPVRDGDILEFHA